MKISYNRYWEIVKKHPRIYVGDTLPKGGIRLFSKDRNGEVHTIVLTHEEFVKEFGMNTFIKLTQTF